MPVRGGGGGGRRRSGSNSSTLDRLVAARFRPDKVRQILADRQRLKTKNPKVVVLTGTSRRGVFYRIPLPVLSSSSSMSNGSSSSSSASNLIPLLPNLPKLFTPTSPPKPLSELLQATPTTPSSSVSSSSTIVCSTSTSTPTAETISSSSSSSTAVYTSSLVAVPCASQQQQQQTDDFWDRFRLWFRENMSTLILNFGSICTLIGFTRSDVLELRGLSVTGSLCAIVYNSTAHPPPIRWTPILWSGTFAAVNGWKILQILHERQGSVHFTVEQEERYSNFFMPHGITPKQFEAIHKKATVLHVKKGELLVRQGDPVAAVYLVVSGVTRASVLGRFVTAASTTPTAQSERAGGASGAWIGEMGLLERVWQQQQQSINNNNTTSNAGTPQQTQQQQKSSMNKAIAPLQKSTDNPPTFATENKSVKQRPESKAGTPSDRKPATSVSDAHAENEPLTSQQQQQQQQAQTIMIKKQQQQHQEQRKLKASHQMYTIVAQEDCIVLRWSYDDMQSLMERSTDMRAALTRAMTAAIVAKVINFTVSRSSAKSTWATWLDDWKYNTLQMTGDEANAAATSSTESTATDATAPMYQEEEDVEENFPDYPLKRFQ